MMPEPRRWERRNNTPALPEIVHPREEVMAAIEALRRSKTQGGARRLEGVNDAPETWAPEACIGIGDRKGLIMPTTLIRQLVAEGYAHVTTAYSAIEPGGRWVSVPVRIYWTGKGIERR